MHYPSNVVELILGFVLYLNSAGLQALGFDGLLQ